MKKTLVWVIEDDDILCDMINEHLKTALPKCTIKNFDSVIKALKATGSPDVILIDTTAIAGGIMPTGCWSLFEANLGYIVEKHQKAAYGIYSAVGVWAEDLVESIQERFKEVKITRTTREQWSIKQFLERSGFEVSE